MGGGTAESGQGDMQKMLWACLRSLVRLSVQVVFVDNEDFLAELRKEEEKK